MANILGSPMMHLIILYYVFSFVKNAASKVLNQTTDKKVQLFYQYVTANESAKEALRSQIAKCEVQQRQAIQQYTWSRLLFHCAQLNVPLTLTHAAYLLEKEGSNGSLSHQSSVCLWNIERVLQALLVAHGNSLLVSSATSTATVTIEAPSSIRPAVVVPTSDAYDRMRFRVGFELREYVNEHHTAALQKAEDTKQSNSNLLSQKGMWLSWSNYTNNDLLKYADDIHLWEITIFNDPQSQQQLKDSIKNERERVLASAHRYRNIKYTTVRFDTWMKNKQIDNVRQAELLNRETRAQFVYSVHVALALFLRITGVVLKSVVIKDCEEHKEIWPEVDSKEEYLKDIEPRSTLQAIEARKKSYEDDLEKVYNLKDEISKVFQNDDVGTSFKKEKKEWKESVDAYNEWKESVDAYNDAMKVIDDTALKDTTSKYNEAASAKFWAMNDPPFTDVNETLYRDVAIGDRVELIDYQYRLKKACQLQVEQAVQQPHLGAIALSEIALVLSAGTSAAFG